MVWKYPSDDFMSFFGELESLQFGITSLSFHSGFKKFPRISTLILVSLKTQIPSTNNHNPWGFPGESAWLGLVAPLAIVWGYNDDLWQLNFQYQCFHIFNINGSIQDLLAIVMAINSLRVERIFSIQGFRLLFDFWIWPRYHDNRKLPILHKVDYIEIEPALFEVVNSSF